MAPEAWRGKPVHASDQYSLACTWVELRLGRRPFSGDNAEVVIRALTATPDLQGLPPPEARMITRALDKEARHRFPSCSEMVRELERVLVGMPELAAVPATIHTPVPEAHPAVRPPAPESLVPEQGDRDDRDDIEDMLGTIRNPSPSARSVGPVNKGGWQRDPAEMSGAAWRSPQRRQPGWVVGVLLVVVALGALAVGCYTLQTGHRPQASQPAPGRNATLARWRCRTGPKPTEAHPGPRPRRRRPTPWLCRWPSRYSCRTGSRRSMKRISWSSMTLAIPKRSAARRRRTLGPCSSS
jgi:hypothetical protein